MDAEQPDRNGSAPEATAAAADHSNQVERQQDGAQGETTVSDETVKERLLELLGKSDLEKTTEKMLRKQLEQELGVELSSKKALIREQVLAYLEQHQPDDDEAAQEESEDEEVQEKPATKKRSGSGLGSVLSEQLQDFLGVESMPRPQVVKAIWEYIKANNLQNPKDKRKIIVDEKLGKIFTPPITMFNMNKQLSKHVFTSAVVQAADDDDDEDDEEEDEKPSSSKPRPAKRSKKAADDGDSPKASRAGTGFAKPIPLSEELAAATGQPAMSRGEFSKWLYAYVNQHELKDPSDKRYANCDDTLQKLTGETRIMLFGGQKYFKEHFKK